MRTQGNTNHVVEFYGHFTEGEVSFTILQAYKPSSISILGVDIHLLESQQAFHLFMEYMDVGSLEVFRSGVGLMLPELRKPCRDESSQSLPLGLLHLRHTL